MVTTGAQFSLILRVELERRPGTLGGLTPAIGRAGGQIGAVDILEQGERHTLRQLTVDCPGEEQWRVVLAAIESLDGVRLIERTRASQGGRIHTGLKMRSGRATTWPWPIRREWRESASRSPPIRPGREYMIRRNTVAVVSDGTAVLGDIGPEAALPVMEGKAVLFKEFADVHAFPVCLDSRARRDRHPRSNGSRRASVASVSRTSPRRAASRSSAG